MDPWLLAKEIGVVDGLRTDHDGIAHLAERGLAGALVSSEPGTRIWVIAGGKRWLLERWVGPTKASGRNESFWDLVIFNRKPTATSGAWAIWLMRAAWRRARLCLTEAAAR